MSTIIVKYLFKEFTRSSGIIDSEIVVNPLMSEKELTEPVITLRSIASIFKEFVYQILSTYF